MNKNKIKRFITIVLIIFICLFTYIKNNKQEYREYHFRNNNALMDHYEKHGVDMDFNSAYEYEMAANEVINNNNSLHKKEAEDNDDVYYLESTNEFVIVSTDGYIRTYFCPNNGKAYFDGQ